jgi:hypothetical protein
VIYFRAIWNIFGIFYDHLVHFMFIWYILCSFGTFSRFLYHEPRYLEKSGNPGRYYDIICDVMYTDVNLELTPGPKLYSSVCT